MNTDAFPESVVKRYRIRRERLVTDPPEFETTIPLTSSRGHVYRYGPGWAGVWLSTGHPSGVMRRLRADFPGLVTQQVAVGECTFRIPMSDLERLLPRLGAKRRRRLSQAQRAAVVERLKPHRFKKTRTSGPTSRPRSDDRHASGVLAPAAAD